MSLEDFIISVYCLVDEMLYPLISNQRLRERGFYPKLTDAEVVSLEIVGEYLGQATDTGIWRYFRNHWLEWFPGLGSRAQFAKQASNLWVIKQQVQEELSMKLGGLSDTLHMSDGFPIPLCKFKRAHFSQLFKGVASYGYCASKSETYYGFKGNLVINSQGVISGITVTPANIDERESLWDMLSNSLSGLMIADKGLLGEDFQQEVRQHTGINLQTPLRDNMPDPRGKDCASWLISTRRLVVTIIGQLTEQFHIQKIWARDLWHLTNRIARKILAHTIGVFINRRLGNNLLQLQNLVLS